MERAADHRVDRGAVPEEPLIDQSDIGARSAFLAIVAGELVELEKRRVVEDEALRVLVRKVAPDAARSAARSAAPSVRTYGRWYRASRGSAIRTRHLPPA